MGLPITFSEVVNQAGDGTLRVSSESSGPTFSASTGLFTPVATPTDIAALVPQYGPKQTRLRRVVISGVCNSGGQLFVRLLASANGGNNGSTTITSYQHDKYNGTAICALYKFTANRTTGSAPVGGADTRATIAEADLTLGIAGSSTGTPAVFEFPDGSAPMIKHQYDWLVVGLNGQALPTGTQVRVTMTWSEHAVVVFGATGDSTTSNATPDLLMSGANSGGIGSSGAFNSAVTVDNFGSNGYTLSNFINNTAGVTFPLSTVLVRGVDAMWVCWGINDARTGAMGSTAAACTNRLTAMLDTVIRATLYGATSGATYTSPFATSYSVASASWSGGAATLVTTLPHGYAVGESIKLQIAGMMPSGYNGTYTCTFPTTTSITYTVADPGAATVMGTATYTTVWPSTMTGLPDCKIILWSPNPITADDTGDGTYGYLSASANTVLSGLWTGMTLAQAAQALTDILYNAYQPFVGDARVFALLNKQDVLSRFALPLAQMTVSGTATMVNQLHPGVWGRRLTLRQIMPTIRSAVNAVRAIKF